MCIIFLEIGPAIRGVENGDLVVPVNNTCVPCTHVNFLAVLTHNCVSC